MSEFLSEIKEDFSKHGFGIIRGFYDRQKLIDPIREDIRWIVEQLCSKYDVKAPTATVEEALSEGYLALAKTNRSWGGEVYDAVKQIPAFMQLVTDPRNSELFTKLRTGSRPGIAAGGYGIRIDAPSEDKYRAPWHQEFPAQLRSPDGIVFWSPLVSVKPEMGPVELAIGSHREGLVPVRQDTSGNKSGAYALVLDREQERLSRYEKVAPTTEPGDLILMDFLTLHQSGLNRSQVPRWSMQFRYFNFADPMGVRLSWKGSFAAGQNFADVLPELAAEQ